MLPNAQNFGDRRIYRNSYRDGADRLDLGIRD